MDVSLAELAAALDARLEGDGALRVNRAAHPSDAAAPTDLALAMAEDLEKLVRPPARAAVLREGADWKALGLEGAILVRRPKSAMAPITARFAPEIHAPQGVHPTAFVDPSAEIGEGSGVGPFVWIGPGAKIGPRARILSHASVAEGALIGPDALIGAGVRICARARIGARAIIHPNAVLGADGFSFATPERGSVESARSTGAVAEEAKNTRLMRVFSLGGLRIGDDVEIGAGAAIDRGTLRDTEIGDGTKIDNLVQIGHNVRMGRNCLICAHVGIAGSTEIGDRVVLAGKVGVADHVRIGSDAVVTAASGVSGDVAPGAVMMGFPALPHAEAIRVFMAQRRLPRFMEKMRGQIAALTEPKRDAS
ncbi:UDP-3-O-(3-hydroxymyristoyl)glucosamine N-acyltransferase [Neomegalonema sp.]|uniref:UDP-3-O-(3-hydroxymyristoyl)glucosamine N-acyltransferase n=1 Tax=Neomegalonema sp. TaxID=2039713 RepID=UPI00260FC40E|nr:UDP-3-O-(3-hydroxymyristoyl)glucosamine N-acyltransferase [Neomegalonema sp.]MDD2868981.1 UDP-3-O-(3-hydroxymyristoyl)glucosamine N-acyltransferase [Neomegalonema sp.]